MNAAVLHTLGKPPRFESFPEPTPGEGEAIVQVRAAALKPVDKQLASGAHYASSRELPAVCGTDGVGQLEDGTRVFFGGPRPPFGAMAERTLILGATGVAGKLAVQIARILGAGRVVAAGRNEQVLSKLGADAVIRLDQPRQELVEAFRREAGFHVILDYLWGPPTEALLAAIARAEFAVAGAETRLVQVGESAGPTITLPAAVLRSAPVTILGTAGIPSWEVLTSAFQQVMNHAARGTLRVDTVRIPLRDIESAWENDTHGRRLVVIP